jgi:hypothetical protein
MSLTRMTLDSNKVSCYGGSMNECDPERTVTKHPNGFSMVNIRMFHSGTKNYVLPSQCEEVFYS